MKLYENGHQGFWWLFLVAFFNYVLEPCRKLNLIRVKEFKRQ